MLEALKLAGQSAIIAKSRLALAFPSSADLKPIGITRLDGLPADEAARGLQQRFAGLEMHINERYRVLYGGAETGADAIALLSVVSDFLSVMREIGREYAGDRPLPLEDAVEAPFQSQFRPLGDSLRR